MTVCVCVCGGIGHESRESVSKGTKLESPFVNRTKLFCTEHIEVTVPHELLHGLTNCTTMVFWYHDFM